MNNFEKFLKKRWDQKSPLLLACSGGPDSKALLYLLFEAGVKPLHVAHVDHSWRKESGKEAQELQKEVEALGFTFHLKKIEPTSSNQEAAAREERLLFFRSLFDQIPFQALLLAHHQDDWAETALKRVLEGAHLPFLAGMQPVSKLTEMPIWRPLLDWKKSEIFSFLTKKKLSFFSDPTNQDPLYLRSRIRGEIFPLLTEKFGKEVSENFVYLAKRSNELREYLDQKVKAIPILEEFWGSAVFLKGVPRVEARYLIQKILKKQSLSRSLLETLLDKIEKGEGKQKISSRVFVHRGTLFLFNENGESSKPAAPLFDFLTFCKSEE